MWRQSPSAVVPGKARLLCGGGELSGYPRPDSRGRLSPHSSRRTYGLATTLGDLLGSGQCADRGLDATAWLLHLSGGEAGAGQRSIDRATRSRSRSRQDTSSQDLAISSRLAERSSRLAVPAAH